MDSTKNSYVPSHSDFIVEFAPGEYRSSLKILKVFKPGQTLATFKGFTRGVKSYSSVQCGRGDHDHVELNSDLAYINHSCEPNLEIDLSNPDQSKWHARASKHINVGDTLTFFYPSTEWDMDQPFKCECGMPSCLGSIQGAKYLSKEDLLARGWVNPWILEMVRERDFSEGDDPVIIQ